MNLVPYLPANGSQTQQIEMC